jgi:hypothetical protein
LRLCLVGWGWYLRLEFPLWAGVFDEDGRYGAYRAVFGDGVRLLLVDRYCVGGFVADCCRCFGVVRE